MKTFLVYSLFSYFQCNPKTQFTCWNGQCISIGTKCDEERNCDDGSDEYQCFHTKIDKQQYKKELVPKNPESNQKLNVTVTFIVYDIPEIDQANIRQTAHHFEYYYYLHMNCSIMFLLKPCSHFIFLTLHSGCNG